MNLQQLIIPEPSKLYSLRPRGINTSKVESLASYAMRLAEAHCIDVCALINRFVHPLIGNKWKDIRQTRGWRAKKVYKAHKHTVTLAHLHFGKWIDMTDETQATVVALVNLTKRQNLHLLTLLPLRGYIRRESILRYQRAWCCCCYEEQKNAEKPVYDLLIWSFRDVCVCCHHQTRLQSTCPFCGKKQLIIDFWSQPGHCSKCGLWLGTNYRRSNSATSEDYWKANAIGDLIASWSELPSSKSKSRSTMQSQLSKSSQKMSRLIDLLITR